jgi:hypothetical protein
MNKNQLQQGPYSGLPEANHNTIRTSRWVRLASSCASSTLLGPKLRGHSSPPPLSSRNTCDDARLKFPTGTKVGGSPRSNIGSGPGYDFFSRSPDTHVKLAALNSRPQPVDEDGNEWDSLKSAFSDKTLHEYEIDADNYLRICFAEVYETQGGTLIAHTGHSRVYK